MRCTPHCVKSHRFDDDDDDDDCRVNSQHSPTPRAVFVKFQQGGRLSARAEGPTLEARRAESGEGFLGGDSEPPPH